MSGLRVPATIVATSLLIAGLSLLYPRLSSGQVCKPTDAKSLQVTLQYLRRLSIDLRGQLPTLEESQEVIRTGRIPDGWIDKWLNHEDFYTQARHYHRDLLWANLPNIDFDNQWKLNRGDGTTTPFWSTYRSGARGGEVGCADKQLERNADGTFKMEVDPKDGKIKREGWVKVKPYWSPDKEVKVCAIDAFGLNGGKDGYDKGGCGENLRFCQAESGPVKTAPIFTKALIDQTLFFAEDLIRGNKPYTDLLNARRTIFNGPAAHLFKHQMKTIDNIKAANIYQTVPDIPFTQTTWKPASVGEKHAGILTMPLYLLKYTSNRSRASQFYAKILCKPFQAPPGGLPAGNDPCHNEPNLMKRCGCKYCHQSLEPAAAYWGRWQQSGLFFMDTKTYPAFKPDCSSTRTNRNTCKDYFTNATHPDQEQYRGRLKAYLFSTEQMKKNIELGPIGIAKEAISSNTFATCTTTNLWGWFVGAPKPSPELMDTFASKFRSSKYNFRALLKEILTHPAYAQGRLYHINYSK